MDLDNYVLELLPKVKANLVIDFDTDNDLISRLIRSALSYAQLYQNKDFTECYADISDVPLSTEQAVIMLVTHWYESRDGSNGGYFSNTSGSEITKAVDRLLSASKEWVV
jgi:uncharacterized phage protein (predicted DNA packaging)